MLLCLKCCWRTKCYRCVDVCKCVANEYPNSQIIQSTEFLCRINYMCYCYCYRCCCCWRIFFREGEPVSHAWWLESGCIWVLVCWYNLYYVISIYQHAIAHVFVLMLDMDIEHIYMYIWKKHQSQVDLVPSILHFPFASASGTLLLNCYG